MPPRSFLLAALVFACCAPARGSGPALGELTETERLSAAAATRPAADEARALAGTTLDGGAIRPPEEIPPSAQRRIAEISTLDPAPPQRAPRPPRDVGPPSAAPVSGPFDLMKRIPPWAVYTGAAVLGGVQGYLSAGLFGAAGGVVLGLGAAALYQRGDPAAAFGWTLGGIVGAALGGPIGALLGAAVGAVAGHFLGALFFK
jgi:hypothetical protein